MIFSCPECEYSQENEPFELCPNCVKKELAELKADLVAAHAHIEHLHGLVKKYNLTRKITEVVSAWEESQCQL